MTKIKKLQLLSTKIER